MEIYKKMSQKNSKKRDIRSVGLG